jgi:hypothetical protein
MQLFMPRRSLVRDLGRGKCVLLPSDPGQERMIELMRLFNPAARPASRWRRPDAGYRAGGGRTRCGAPAQMAAEPFCC